MIFKLLVNLVAAALLLVPPSSSFSIAPFPSGPRGGGALNHRNNKVPLPTGTCTAAGSVTRVSAAASNDNSVNSDNNHEKDENKPLPRELLPITLGVFAQMLGEGISLSSLALYLTKLGATPVMVGLAISCFSVSQMTFAPILVGLSSKIGRSIVLRICLAGAALSSLLIAFSGSVNGVIAGRALAGVFAACVPVAQSAVTDIVSKDQTALGLSRVSAAAQLGVVVGPLASATFQEGFAALGIPAARCLPAVFVLNGCNAMFVLGLMAFMDRRTTVTADSVFNEKKAEDGTPNQAAAPSATASDTNKSISRKDETTTTNTVRYAQPILRTITIVVGWTAILSNSIYGLFAPKFMGYQQAQLSATYSSAAILMVATQIIFPTLVAKIGEHLACAFGILMVGMGIGGLSLIRVQPLHSILYMMNRAGAAVADTSTAALVASSSGSREDRSRNLGLLTSTRAAARIFTPLLSSKMFQMSCNSSTRGGPPPGALPFVTAACFCMAVAPLPSVLRRAEKRLERQTNVSQ